MHTCIHGHIRTFIQSDNSCVISRQRDGILFTQDLELYLSVAFKAPHRLVHQRSGKDLHLVCIRVQSNAGERFIDTDLLVVSHPVVRAGQDNTRSNSRHVQSDVGFLENCSLASMSRKRHVCLRTYVRTKFDTLVRNVNRMHNTS